MECKDYRERFPLLLADSLDEIQKSEIESHLAACPECREEFATAKEIWELLGELPQPDPSSGMRAGFDAILSNYKEELILRRNPLKEWLSLLEQYWALKAKPRLAFSIVLLVIGLAAGYFMHQPDHSTLAYNRQIDSLYSQISQIRQVMMLSLLQDPSASQRIRAVSYSEDMGDANLKIINALLTTLNDDPNVNVRLATLEALVKFSGNPAVREGLVRSIDHQESPIMQSAIADIMVKLQEKSSVQPLQKLLTKKGLNNMVKIKIENSIQKLI